MEKIFGFNYLKKFNGETLQKTSINEIDIFDFVLYLIDIFFLNFYS